MNLLRRQLLQLAAGAVAAPAVARRAFADAYPSRPVRLIVGFTPAGGNDIVARLMGQWLTERLGQTFVIENRPAPAVFAINSSVPAKTVTEFIAHAKANPGRINMGSAGIGSTGHLAGELFKLMAGVNLIHVPYRGNAPALIDLMAGQIEVLFPSLGSSIEYVKTGKLRALAVTDATRADAVPELPTVAETLPGYQAASFYGIGAPRNTPAEIVEVLNKAVNAGLVDPKLNARLADLGNVPLPGPPATFGKLIADETEKWGKVIRFAGIKPQ